MKKILVRSYPYAIQEGMLCVPDDTTDIHGYVTEHFKEIAFTEPELDYAGTDIDVFVLGEFEHDEECDTAPTDGGSEDQPVELYRFGKDPAKDTVLYYGEYVYSDMPAIEAWFPDDGPETITEVIDYIPIEKDEVILNHDILFDKKLVNAIIDYLGTSVREVFFGPYMTKTLVVKLKEGWKELCLPRE